jgi:AraC family transcriptional regulator, L-rhamnose operon transcriptional activator RhaR
MPGVDGEPPLGTSHGLFHFNEATLAYAGSYLHEHDSPVHSHSFVEIAFPVRGTATHYCLAGRQEVGPGDVILLRPGVWHGYENCSPIEVYNCCFSSDLLRHELSWTREDPLLGYVLWAGPYSSPGRGVLTTRLAPSAFDECMTHLQALAALRDRPVEQHRGDIVGRLALLFSELGRAVANDGALVGEANRAHPVVVRAMRLLEADLARHWTLTRLADELHTSPGYLVRLFKAATGLPPMAYLARVRVEHAAVLLLHSDEPITGIGQAVGWPDQNYFARRFKSHYGLSASAYRQRFATGARHLHHDASRSEQVEDAVS